MPLQTQLLFRRYAGSAEMGTNAATGMSMPLQTQLLFRRYAISSYAGSAEMGTDHRCRYRHENAAADAALRGVCKNYSRGYCKHGQNCHFRHEKTDAAHVWDLPAGVCRHFVRGYC